MTPALFSGSLFLFRRGYSGRAIWCRVSRAFGPAEYPDPRSLPEEAQMKNKKKNNLCSIAGILLFVACSLHAQDKPGTIAALEFQKPKNGMAPQYEAGRKQKAAWHKQQNDPQPLLVWEIMSGDNTGTYVVGRLQQHWADFDKPPISDEADLAEFQKVVGSFVDSLTARYYE